MGSTLWEINKEEKSDDRVNRFTRGEPWSNISDSFKNKDQYPPKYAYNIQATVSGQFFAQNNFWGDEWAKIWDCDNSLNGESLLSSNISNNTWELRSADLVSLRRVPSTLTTSGSGIFTNKKPYLTWTSNSDVIQILGLRNRRVDIKWSDPTLTISTPSSTGGSITFSNSSSTTATYNGSQRYTISYYQKKCIFTITAVPEYGYKFSHWGDDANNTTATRTLTFTDADLTSTATTKTYTAVFERIPCKITYEGNGSTGGSVAPQSGYIGKSLNLQDNGFVKEWNVTFYSNENPSITDDSLDEFETQVSRAEFKGWYTADGARVGGSGDSYTPEVDITLYAHWGEMPAVTTPIPPRNGYTLLGWYTERIGGTKVANSGGSYTPPRERVCLYARWKRNSINRIYIGTQKPKFYKGKKPIRSIYLGTSLIYRVFLPKISYDNINTFGNLLVPLPGDAPKTYTLPEANLENAEGNVSYALYSDSKCKTPVGAGITFDENTRQVTISNEAKDTVAAQNTYKDGLAKFYVKATYKNLSAIGGITLKNYKVTATFRYCNVENEYIDKTTEVYYGTSVEEFANGITDFQIPENDENYHYTIIGWVDQNKKSTIKNVKGNTIFDFLFNAKSHEIDPNIDGYEKKVPTCTESGYIKGYCGYCAKQENGYKGLIQVNSPATGHKDTNGDNICDVCGEIFVDSGTCGDNLTYTLDSNGVWTIPGTGDMQNSSFGWNKNKIKSVIISDGVTSIGDSAFFNCTSLTSVTIPDSIISIGDSAFSSCSGLTSVTIPDSVTSIGSSAFNGCKGLTSLTIPDSVTSIGDSTFSGCYGLTSLIIPNSVTNISDSAFSNCRSLISITIPDSVTSIGNNAFSDCYGLTSITIGNSVTSIGYGAFRNCYSLTDITVSTGNTVYHSDNNCLIETESKTLILGCKNSIIPSNGSVTNIGHQAFFYCTGLTSIIIPNSITSINSFAFAYCRNLVEVNFSARTDIPTLESPDVFDNTPDNLAIKVPSDLVDQWKAATNWDAYADKIKGIKL